jgi:cardiolipin synthase A/B
MTAKTLSSVQFHFSGDSYFNSIFENIQKAAREIRIEMYMFNLDELGKKLLESLKQAHERGVEVFLLVDGIGTLGFITDLAEYCSKEGIHFKIYHPLPLTVRILKFLNYQGLNLKSLRRFFLMFKKINNRDHRKIFLIDQKVAFIGSQNVNKIHCESMVSTKAWRDTGVEVVGEAVTDIVNMCRMTWEKMRTERSFSQLSQRRQRRTQHIRELLQAFHYAKSRIWITTAYFLPNRKTLRALEHAARRGVNVVICLPAVSDIPFMKWTAWLLYDRLLRAGVEIYEYQNRILHAKSMIIDDWGTVGSYNFNHRSLIHDLEIEVTIDKAEWLRDLEKQWHIDISLSQKIELKDRGHHNIFLRAIANIFYWFRYWL